MSLGAISGYQLSAYKSATAVVLTNMVTGNPGAAMKTNAPGNNAHFTTGSINLAATATASEGNSLIGISTTAPYSYPWANLGVGTHTITAIATDTTVAASHNLAATASVAAN